jgi:hypothetical protein
MRRTQGEWARIVARYRTSGRSARRFSADEGISEQSLRSWTRKLDGPRSMQTRRDEGFVEIGGTARPGPLNGEDVATAAGDGFVIRLESGVGIEVRPKTDRALLGWVLTLLMDAS